MPPIEGDEKEVKEGKGLKILPPNKVLTIQPLSSSRNTQPFSPKWPHSIVA